MSPALPKCPLCGLDPPLATISPRADQDVNDVQCKCCGNFAVCPGHVSLDWNRGHVPTFLRGKGVAEYDIARANALMRAYLSIYTRECTERGTPAELITLLMLPHLNGSPKPTQIRLSPQNWRNCSVSSRRERPFPDSRFSSRRH